VFPVNTDKKTLWDIIQDSKSCSILLNYKDKLKLKDIAFALGVLIQKKMGFVDILKNFVECNQLFDQNQTPIQIKVNTEFKNWFLTT